MRDKGSLNLIREINTSLILDILKEKAPLSRYDISKITKLSAPTVSNIINNLVKVGFVKETGMGESIGGRPPLLLDLNLEGGFVIGVDIGSDNITSIVCDFLGNMILKSISPVEKEDNEFTIFDKIIHAISDLIDKSGKDSSLFLGVGIGISGDIDSRSGIVRRASRLNWENVPLKSIIETSFNMPTYIDENVRLLTLAEKWFGVGRHYRNLVCIRVGDDIGAGIIIDDSLYTGGNEKAGVNIGHLVVETSGRECRCGNHGCLQSVVSSEAIVSRAVNLLKNGGSSVISKHAAKGPGSLTVQMIAQAAGSGDKLCTDIMDETGKYLAIAISNIINCLDPQVVIIGGGIAQSGEILLAPVRKYLKKYTVYSDSPVKILQSKLLSDAYAIGAATIVLHHVFTTPKKFLKKSGMHG